MNEFEPPKKAIPASLASRLVRRSTPISVYKNRMLNSAFLKAQHLNEIKHRADKALINVYVVQLKRNQQTALLREKIERMQHEANTRKASIDEQKIAKVAKLCAKIDYTTARYEANVLSEKQFLIHKIKHEECRAETNRKRFEKMKMLEIQKFTKPRTSSKVIEIDCQT